MADLFRKVHESYWNSSVIIDAVGTYEDRCPNGYGHLGHNKARFVVRELINVQLVQLKATKKGRQQLKIGE